MQDQEFDPAWLPTTGDGPQLEGPDYVALVIEWSDEMTPADAELEAPRGLALPPSHLVRNTILALGGLVALVFAGWGIHRLRHA